MLFRVKRKERVCGAQPVFRCPDRERSIDVFTEFQGFVRIEVAGTLRVLRVLELLGEVAAVILIFACRFHGLGIFP